MTALKLHVMPGSAPCRAVLLTHKILGEQPGLEIVQVNLQEEDHLKAEFLELNPLHCVPTLEYAGKGSVWESRAIMKYLCALAGPTELYPASAWARAQVDRLLCWDQGNFYKAIGGFVYPQVFRGEEPDEAAIKDLRDVLHFLDRHQLGDEDLDSGFLTGTHATLADISIACGLTMLEFVDFGLDDYPRLRAWKGRMSGLLGWDEVNAPFYAWKAQLTAQGEPSAED